MVSVSVRHAEPQDAEAVHRILAGPRAAAGTLQLPLQSVEAVRRQFFSDAREGVYHLVACVEGEVVGHLGLEAYARPRRRHAGAGGGGARGGGRGGCARWGRGSGGRLSGAWGWRHTPGRAGGTRARPGWPCATTGRAGVWA